MKKYIISNNNIPSINRCVACIGYFDGIHLGHQELINATVKLACEKGIKATLIFFNPDPINIIYSTKNKHLLSYQNKLKTINYFGIEEIIIIKFNQELMKTGATNFIKKYLNLMNIDTLVYGYDFKFGYKSLGDYKTLKKYGNFYNVIVPERAFLGKKISSSRIKDTLYKGNFKLVNKLLGYKYYLETRVLKCSKSGKFWLIEAILKDPLCIMPKNGKYNNNLTILDGKIYLESKYKIKKDSVLIIDLIDYE